MSDGLAGATPENPVHGHRLRVYLGESDRDGGAGRQPLYEAIVLTARRMHLAGATVLRGPMGYGANSRIHTTKILRLSEDLPIVVELIDTPDKIAALVAAIEPMMAGGLMTIDDVQIVHSSHAPSGAEK